MRLVTLRRDGLQPGERSARELERRLAGRQVHDPHVAPEHAVAQTRAQRLGAGLLGGETLGIGGRTIDPPLGARPLPRGEDAREKPLAMAVDHLLDPRDVHQVGADAENHRCARARPRSMAPRMVRIAWASPTSIDSAMRKWPMLSSTTSPIWAISSAVA